MNLSAPIMDYPMRLLPFLLLACAVPDAAAQSPDRARDLGIPFEGVPGPHNAITDVAGVEVGHVTLVQGDDVRTGVTAILPRGRTFDPVYAATYALNGNGEMTGIHWIDESGFLETPILITNTFSVGVVRDAAIAWMDSTGLNADPDGGFWYTYPVVAETYDVLNDILGQHVTRRHAIEALNAARGGPVAEGNVGGGTGMSVHGFKGGIGTSSRLLASGHTLGVLVQANYGGRDRFTVAGVPVGKEITDLQPNWEVMSRGSIIVVVATDAPLLPNQLQRLVERVPLAIGRLGGLGTNGSGDIFISFSTANPGIWEASPSATVQSMPNSAMNELFEATVGATEEAILNAMAAAETMTGYRGLTIHALPHDRLQDALKKYGRWVDPASHPRVADVPPSQLERFSGVYRDTAAEAERTIYLEDGKLFYDYGEFRTRLVPLTDGRLLQLGGDWILEEAAGRLRWTLHGEVQSHLERVGER